MKIIDISMEIRPDMIVYPGNPAPRIEQYKKAEETGINESSLFMGNHTGTHVDSKLHIKTGGRSAAELPLESFYGPCMVLDMTEKGRKISADLLREHDIPAGLILLLKTENSLKGYDHFRENYAHLTKDGAKYLAEREVKTIGVDYLSVEPFQDGGEIHDILIGAMTVFEGLDLRNVSAGHYIFAGLPLKINADGAPARAILIVDED
jgi:arylformamidase